MDFSKFYYFGEGKLAEAKNKRKEIWKIIIDSNALEDLDIHFNNDVIEYNPKKKFPMERLEQHLSKSNATLYVADEKKFRIPMSKEFMKKLKGKNLKLNYELEEGRRPTVIACKDNICIKFIFKNNIKNTVRSVDYEDAIVQVWNGKKAVKSEIKEPAKNIVDLLKEKINKEVEAIHSGSKQLGKESLTPFWIEGNDKPDSTPKPDFRISNEYRISLKIGTAAQLCSSKIIGAEGNKLILSSLEGTNVGKKLKNEIKSMVSKRFERPEGFDTEKRLARSMSDIEEFGIKFFEEQHDVLTKMLNDASNKDIQFKRNFIYEAMTGYKKFEIDEGKANFILSSPYDGSFINFKHVDKVNLDKLVKQARLYVSFKSSGKSKSSNVRINVPIKDEKKTINNSRMFSLQYFEEKAEEFGIDHKLLNEGLKEVGDWFKKVFNIIKETIKKGIKWVLDLFGIKGEIENLNQNNINFLEA